VFEIKTEVEFQYGER